MSKRWLREHYGKLPLGARRVLTNKHLRRNLKVLELTRRQYPKVYAIASSITNLLVKRGRTKEAIRVWSQTIKQFPGEPNPYFQRAHWALTRRDFEEVQKYLRLCLRRDR